MFFRRFPGIGHVRQDGARNTIPVALSSGCTEPTKPLENQPRVPLASFSWRICLHPQSAWYPEQRTSNLALHQGLEYFGLRGFAGDAHVEHHASTISTYA